jgi:hypothetical protein
VILGATAEYLTTVGSCADDLLKNQIKEKNKMPTEINRASHRAKLIKYHPERFFILRSFPEWDEAASAHHRRVMEDRANALIPIGEAIAYIHFETEELLHDDEHMTFTKNRIERAVEDLKGGGCGAIESAIQMWMRSGEQIFDLSAISAMFLTADSLDVPIAKIKLPFESSYLYWGSHLQISSPFDGRYIDGCYVTRRNDESAHESLEFTFTSSLVENDPWDKRSLLANIVVDCEGAMTFFSWDDNVSVGDIVKDLHQYEPETQERWAKVLHPALQMACNCLCYLAWEKSEMRQEYPPEAPAKLVKQCSSHRPTEQRRAASKLNALGFRVVTICGERMAESIGLTKGERAMPPHWRRGHWRHQRFGKSLSSVKVLWINSAVVNVDKGSPEMGHIYVPPSN